MLKIKSLVWAFFLAASLVPTSGASELKLGYVNTQRIFKDAPAAVKAAKKLDAEFSRRDQELQRMNQQLEAMQAKLEKEGVTMSESERRNKEREFGELSRDFQRKQREFREDLNLRQNEEYVAVIEKANKAIKQIAEAEKYDLIVQDALYFSPKVDITDKVIKALTDSK